MAMITPAAAHGKGGAKGMDSALVVFSTAQKDEIGIKTLVGDYQEQGGNHGRKVYKRVQKPYGDKTTVFLYFWDDRDGPDCSGWWFGDQVGGTQVWSRNKMKTATPPQGGWTIPWDGAVCKELVVMSSKEKQQLAQNEAKVQAAKRLEEEAAKKAQGAIQNWEARVEAATEKIAAVEIDTEQAVEDAQLALEGGEDAEIAAAASALATQATALAEAQKFIAEEGLAAQKAPPALKAEVVALGQRVKKLQEIVKAEQDKMKTSNLVQVNAQAAAEEAPIILSPQEQQLEEQHSRQLEEMLPIAMEKVDTAEDEVEKVAIAAAPLNVDTADDLRSVMLGAIKETEQRVKAAQAAIGEARRYISTKISQVQRFVRTTKKAALEEFQALQNRLTEAQNKLNPFKTARADFENKAHAKKVYAELSSKLAGAEIEVEKAAMMTAPLGTESAEAVKETESTLNAAQSALSQTLRLIESKLRTAQKTGQVASMFEDVKGLEERAKQSQEKLDEVRKTLKQTQIRIAADTLLKDVSDKVNGVEDELQRMSEAELPFLRADQKGEELEKYIKEAELIATTVHTSLAEAQTFVARKLVEVARFTDGPARAVKEEVDMLQKRLEDGRRRLQDFRSGTAERKRTFYLQDVETKVAAAEAELSKMTEAAAALGSIGVAGETVSDSLKEALEQAINCERGAQASIVVARKHLVQKTAELKKLALAGTGSGAELGKLQTRVNTMQHEIQKLRDKTKNAEERIRVKQLLAEVAVRLQAAEAEVDRVAAANVPLGPGESPAPEQVERTEKATSSAQTKLSATAKVIDVKLKTAAGFLEEELQGMRGRIAQAEAKLNTVIRSAKDQKERLLASEVVSQALEKVESAETAVRATNDAELPFLKGLEVLDAKEAQLAVDASEKAAAGAQKAVSEARTFVMQKLGDAKQFTSVIASETCTKELLALQKKLDVSASRLAELKKDTAERKRRTQMQASGVKVADVESALENLTAEMAKLADDKMSELSPEEAKAACEAIAGAEHAAQISVSDARKFLAARSQEAKSLAEAQRGPMIAELSKLQSRLTQCQVELAKMSKLCTEREQRFVAQKLLRDAEEGFAGLEATAQAVIKNAAPLLDGSADSGLADLRLEIFVSALAAYSKKESLTADQAFKNIAGKGSTIAQQNFVKFVDKLPEVSGVDNATFTEDQGKALFATISKSGTLDMTAFKALLRERRVCTVAVAATDAREGGKEVTTIEIGEGIEVLETSSSEGVVSAKCCLARDGSTVWTTLESSEGSNFKLAAAGRADSIEACANALVDRCKELAKYADQKTAEVSSVKQGPLAEIKPKLAEVRAKVGQEQARLERVKKQILTAKTSLLQKREEEMQALHEVKCKAMIAAVLKEATDAVETAEGRATKVVDSAKDGTPEKLQAELTIVQLQDLKAAADAAVHELAKAKALVAKSSERFETQKGPSRNLVLELCVQLTKLTSRAAASEKKCKASTEAIRVALDQLVKSVTRKARDALRASARKAGKDVDQLFEEVSGGKGEISQDQFQKFVAKLPAHGLSKEQVQLVFKAFGPYGLRKVGFAKALQEFYTCSTSITITDKLQIAESSSLRKLEVGEVFEVMEGPVAEAETQVSRVKGRALRDGVTGWVTMLGNQGTPYLKATPKPFMWAAGEGKLQDGVAPSSKVLRPLARDEVLELLEGPREEASAAELFLNVTSGKEGPDGWITLKDSVGAVSAVLGKELYACKASIAMTDQFDIKECKVVRKIAVGEALKVIGGTEKQDKAVDITRLRFRAVKDGSEGWVTLTGNQGTVFVEPSTIHYVVSADGLSLRAAAARDSAEIAKLKKGTILTAKTEPVENKPASRLVVRARAIEDGLRGCVSFELGVGGVPLKPWMPRYTCRAAVDLTSELDASSSVSKKAAPGEVFEAIEGPSVDKKSGSRRVRCAADGTAVGWATLRGSGGQVFLEAA